MEQRSKNVATKDVPIKSRREEYVGSMGRRSKDAVMKDAPNLRRREESALVWSKG